MVAAVDRPDGSGSWSGSASVVIVMVVVGGVIGVSQYQQYTQCLRPRRATGYLMLTRNTTFKHFGTTVSLLGCSHDVNARYDESL